MLKEQFDKDWFCHELSAMHSSKIRFDKNDSTEAIELQKLTDWVDKHPILFMFSRKKVLSELSKIKDAHHIAHCMATDCSNHSDEVLKHLDAVYGISEIIREDYERPVGIHTCPICESTDIGVKDNISDNKVWAYCRCCGTKGPALNRNQFRSDDELINAAYDAWNKGPNYSLDIERSKFK